MPYFQLKEAMNKLYGGAIALRSVLRPEVRQVINKNLFFASIFVLFVAIFSFAIDKSPAGSLYGLNILALLSLRIWGVFLVMFSAAFVFSALEAMHRSYYFTGLKEVLKENAGEITPVLSWEVATIIFDTKDSDITGGYLESDFGQEVLFRAGVTEEAYGVFVKERKGTLTAKEFVVDREGGVVLSTYTKSVYKYDEELRRFLQTCNINESHLVHAAEWVTNIERKERRVKRWWSRDNLGRIPGIGKDWSYGETYLLRRFGHEMTEDPMWGSAMITRHEEEDEVEELENILCRSRQSNALVLAHDISNARVRTAQLYYKIREGLALPPIEDKLVYVLNVEAIIMATGDKMTFEKQLMDVFNQAIFSGNSILYIENVTASIESTRELGVDLVDLISPYFDSPSIQLVLAELSENFDRILARDTRITQAFDVIQMKDVENAGVVELLEQRAMKHELKTNIVFTVPALDRIANLADRYFPTGVMPDKAYDLLEELVPVALSDSIRQVLPTDVDRLVTRKSHVPVGDPNEQERDTLLNLENILHKRVIAQEKAIDVVSMALRRARSGIGSGKKPIGTFLFLGPTGVGKTETAKALAEVLFNDETAMTRLDMSEFQSDNALEELIGSATTGKTGRLDMLMRERQYGVLLLDEFEKSNRMVHDLFLQILDEGHFTDGFGKSVNMRNMLIIATSNAGADLIWELEKQGKDVQKERDTLIDYMISQNTFRPEFLNRFDEIVVFHALKPTHVREIAQIHLNSFAKRIRDEKNIVINITDELVDYIAQKGYNPKFGGRPLEHAIQEIVEQTVADEILKGNIKPGETFTFKIQ